jgi:hypothetical protein
VATGLFFDKELAIGLSFCKQLMEAEYNEV